MLRISKPEKWKDSFFMNLRPIEKLLFIYIYENCDDAGFFELNFSTIISDVGISSKDLSPSLKNIEKTFLLSDDGEKIWLKKFLLHQNKLPLDLNTPEGNYIKYQLESNYKKFGEPKDFDYILGSTKTNTSKSRKKVDFLKPELSDVIDFFSKHSSWSHITYDKIENIYHFYDSKGWTIGKSQKPMKDWQKAFIYCFTREKNAAKSSSKVEQNKPQQQTKIDILFQENQKLEGFDYSQLKKNTLF
jgi:hypothetical protein